MQTQNQIAIQTRTSAMTQHMSYGRKTMVSPFTRSWPGQAKLESSDFVGDPQTILALTDRECTILQLLSHGHSNKEAAQSLGISPETVKSHVKNIFKKLCVDRRTQAVSRALGLGVISAA